MTWQPIAVDLWAKTWRSHYDDFVGQRFTDCYWTRGDSMMNVSSHWVNLGANWVATHWMPVPAEPNHDER